MKGTLQCSEFRHFIPAHQDEGTLPMEVLKMRSKDNSSISDQLAQSGNSANNNSKALRRMSKILSMVCAALAQYHHGESPQDARSSRHDPTDVHLSRTSPPPFGSDVNAIRLQAHRSMGIWTIVSWTFSEREVEDVDFS